MHRLGTTGIGIGVGIAVAVLGSACRNASEDCHLLVTCGYGSEGAGGGGGETPRTCIPSENGEAVGNECGVFVDPNAPGGGMGTKESPLGTMGEAVARMGADRNRIYACAAEFGEEVRLPGGTELYGGLECTRGWGYVGESRKTRLRGPGGGKVALRLEAGRGTKVRDVEAVAWDAQGAGESSIAVIAEEVEGEIRGCAFEAGMGRDGEAGDGYATGAQPGETGLDGNEACTANSIIGADAVSSRCGGEDSTSGPGGNGFAGSGGDGTSGAPLGSMNGGVGAIGEAGCSAGTKGEDGAPGVVGAGATEAGTLAKTGYEGAAGRDGQRGGPGQGGGGGGGAKGGSGALLCPGATTGGAAGGSGGSGGCGGAGGRGGRAGGSSIALLSVDSRLVFAGVTLRAGGGGKGGDGGAGQNGGAGGFPGAGGGVPAGATDLKPGCSGGPGGQGGTGGQGGGGRGGHSAGIAYRGEGVPSTEGVTFVTGTAGEGGMGGDAGGHGAPGVAKDVQEFE